jgi:hypothetical protein
MRLTGAGVDEVVPVAREPLLHLHRAGLVGLMKV